MHKTKQRKAWFILTESINKSIIKSKVYELKHTKKVQAGAYNTYTTKRGKNRLECYIFRKNKGRISMRNKKYETK